MEWLTLLAIVVGPISAVFVTRWVDARRERHTRRMEIFKTLMRTRRTPMYPEHVGALNLIELEFYRDKTVLAQWRDLFQHFGTVHVRRQDEIVDDNTPADERAARDTRFALRLYNERQSLLAKLLHAMAKVLKFKVEQLEIFEGGYTPQGWQDIETEQMIVRRLFADIGAGRRVFPIGVFYFPGQSDASTPPAVEKQPEEQAPT
jgi:hypothetical protein